MGLIVRWYNRQAFAALKGAVKACLPDWKDVHGARLEILPSLACLVESSTTLRLAGRLDTNCCSLQLNF